MWGESGGIQRGAQGDGEGPGALSGGGALGPAREEGWLGRRIRRGFHCEAQGGWGVREQAWRETQKKVLGFTKGLTWGLWRAQWKRASQGQRVARGWGSQGLWGAGEGLRGALGSMCWSLWSSKKGELSPSAFQILPDHFFVVTPILFFITGSPGDQLLWGPDSGLAGLSLPLWSPSFSADFSPPSCARQPLRMSRPQPLDMTFGHDHMSSLGYTSIPSA